MPIIDGFDDDDFSEWTGLDAGEWSQNTNTVWHGTSSAEVTGFDQVYSLPGDGLNNYYSKGDGHLRVFIRGVTDPIEEGIFINFGAQDNSNTYVIDFGMTSNDADIRKEINGTLTNLGDLNPGTISSGVWYEIEVLWDDGTLGGSDGDITCTIYDRSTDTELDTETVNDTESVLQDNSGVGLIKNQQNSGQTVLFDHLQYGVPEAPTNLSATEQ